MNSKEGLRRLAIVLGFVGGIVGTGAAVVYSLTLKESYDNNQTYERLSTRLNGVTIPIKPDDLRVEETELSDEIAIKTGIKKLHFTPPPDDKSLTMSYIETTDNNVYFNSGPPKVWQYLTVLILPFLGFAVLWVPTTLLSWVLSGFVKNSTT